VRNKHNKLCKTANNTFGKQPFPLILNHTVATTTCSTGEM